MTKEELIAEIESTLVLLKEEDSKTTKAASKRARKHSATLKNLAADYRKASLEAEK